MSIVSIMTKLISVKPSTREGKKLVAEFLMPNGRTKHTHFGATGYTDYTKGASTETREAYRNRHKKDLETNDPTKAGFLSYFILWGDSRSVSTNVSAFKRRFGL